MKERPILFSAPMVRAMLAGTKTQTRRVVKPPRGYEWLNLAVGTMVNAGGHKKHISDLVSPYGQPGDRLWVRETYMDLGACYLYRADADAERERALVAPGQRWCPSTTMPRAASRITLELTGVRVERLADISEADAIAEGIGSIRVSEHDSRWVNYMDPGEKAAAFGDPRFSFWSLWESINGRASRDANPWVWVVEFRRAA